MVRLVLTYGWICAFAVNQLALADRIPLLDDSAPKATYSAAPIAGRSAPVAPIRISLKLSSLEADVNRDGFAQVRIEGLRKLERAGAPELFTTGSLIAVPEGYRAELRAVEVDTREVTGTRVAPRQKAYRCDCELGRLFQFDSELYRSNVLYPNEVIRLEPVGKLHGVNLMRVGVYPLQMRFSDSTLLATRYLSAEVHFIPTGATRQVQHLAPSLFELVRASTVNAKSLSSQELRGDAPEFLLIVAADSLIDSLAPFIEWEQSKGTLVKVVSYTQAGGSNKAVRAYIREFVKSNAVKPSQLLFVGNKTSLPPILASTASGPAATDYEYALYDSSDEIPDALYGRLLADSPAEVLTQINRWIAFEKNPTDASDWYAQGATIASNEGSGPSDKEYAESVASALTSHTYTKVDPFLQGEHNATISNITQAVNAGRSWIAYFGHGDGSSWPSTNDNFDVDSIRDLGNNGGKLPVIIDVACLNAAYNKYNDVFGKVWVTHQKDNEAAGAVAFYGGAVIISWDPPAIMSEGIAKTHFEKPVHSLGGSVFAGQLYLIEQKGNDDEIIDNLRWYNLFGNPSMLMRTEAPKSLSVAMNTPGGASQSLRLVATDLNGAPLQNLRVSVRQDGSDPVAVAFTDLSGVAELSLQNAVSHLDKLVTVSGYNTETQQMLIQ